MNFEFFVAKRIFWSKDNANAVSKPIVNIAVAGIALGIAVMLLAVGIVTGFQGEITKKVIGFQSHLKVVSLLEESNEYNKLIIDPRLLESLSKIPAVKKVQLFAQQPGIIEFNKEIKGILIKGLDSNYLREFFTQYKTAGTLPQFVKPGEIMLSEALANKLNFKLKDRIKLFFVDKNQQIKSRNFTVGCLFNTGLETFDLQQVFIGLAELQKIKNYGLEAFVQIDSSAAQTQIEGIAFGGDKKYRYSWNTTWKGKGPHKLMGTEPKIIRLCLSDGNKTVSDTAYYNTETKQSYSTGGSHRYYAEGYDVYLHNFSDLEKTEALIYELSGYNLTTRNVKNDSPELFNWLNILNLNVYIVIVLMLVVAVINMCSALLILILEKANFIGLFKALGCTNYSLRKVFLYNAFLLIAKGLFWGNFLGIAIALIQQQTGWLQLPEEQYYLKIVPIYIDWLSILLLNVGTILITLLVLILPSFLISRISPAKTIRYNN